MLLRMGLSWGLVGGVRGRKRGDAKNMLFGVASGIVQYFKDIRQGALGARVLRSSTARLLV